MQKVKMFIEGMQCGHCAETVKNALQSLGEIKNISVDSKQGTATMQTTQTDERLKIAVEDTGYKVSRIIPM
jgi:copper chaperone CopZ